MIEFRGPRELLAVSVVTGALAVGALLGSTSSLQKRTAIRVECGGDVAACEAAEAVALDIWSERRAPHMPIDVVVDPAGLAKLREMRVGFTVLVDDIDAEADAERMRIEHATIACSLSDRARSTTARASAPGFSHTFGMPFCAI